MIESRTADANGSVEHIGSGTVTTTDLLAGVNRTGSQPAGVVWDFRSAQFDVSLDVVQSRCYPPVQRHINLHWRGSRVAFLVSAHLHKHMIELFAEEGAFEFPWQVFFSRAAANDWINPAHEQQRQAG